MARVRYLLKLMLIWMFILGWWTGLLVWVAATGVWPKGALGAIVRFFCMMFWAMPTIVAYWSWEHWRDQETNGATEPGGAKEQCHEPQGETEVILAALNPEADAQIWAGYAGWQTCRPCRRLSS